MDWVAIGTLAATVAAVAAAVQAWTAWKSHQREETRRFKQYNPSPIEQYNPSPSPPVIPSPPPAFPSTYSPPRANLESEVGADYTKLRDLLAARRYKEADQETLMVMLWVACQEKQGYLDSEAMKKFPCLDLRTIDRLWVQHSNGRFGFSVQQQIHHEVRSYEEFARRVGWLVIGKEEASYNKLIIGEFRAPLGHLPMAPLVGRVESGGVYGLILRVRGPRVQFKECEYFRWRSWSSCRKGLLSRVETCRL